MPNYFQSVTAKFGVDTSDWSKGIANILNEAQGAASQLQQIFRASGLRSAARFLGIGAPLFAAYESYRTAETYVKELEAEQTKAIENIYTQINAFRGTDIYPQKLQEAAEQVKNLQNSISGFNLTAVGSLKTIQNFGEYFQVAGQKALGALAYVGAGIDAVVTRGQGGTISSRFKSYIASVQESGNEALEDAQNKGRFDALKARADQQKEEAKQKQRIDQENAEDTVAGKGTSAELQFYKNRLSSTQNKLANDQAGIAREAQEEGISGEAKKNYYLNIEAETRKKIGELTEKLNAENDAYAQKQTEEQTKQAALDEDIANAKQKHEELTAKTVGLEQEKNKIVKDGIQAELDLNAIQDKRSEEYLRALEKVNELYGKYEEVNQRITEQTARQTELKAQQTELEARRSQQQDARLQQTDAEIKKSGGGAQKKLELLYDQKEKQAEDEYKRAVEDRAKAFDPKTGGYDTTNPAYKRAQDEYTRAKQLQAEADTLHKATGSKEGFEQLLTDQTFKEEMDKNRKEVEAITKILGPLLKPTSIK